MVILYNSAFVLLLQFAIHYTENASMNIPNIGGKVPDTDCGLLGCIRNIFQHIRVCAICEKRQKQYKLNLSLTPSKICKKILQIKVWLN